MTRDRSDLRLVLIRYQAALFFFLAIAPLAVAAPLLGRSSSTNLTTGIGFPLLGDGKIPTWLLPCIYIATITGPLLSWRHGDIEVGAGRFERWSFPAPHLLASGLAVVTLFAVSSGPTRADALFWVAASMAIANLSATLVRQHAWAAVLLITFVVLSLLLQGRLDVWRDSVEAAAATLVWVALAMANILRQRHHLLHR
jgi:hypothetical protein